MKKIIRRIGVFTSGGDAPGMNAAIRAVVRAGSYYDMHTFGIFRGYQGMIGGDCKRLEARDVSNIVHRGGTKLLSARSDDFRTKEGREKAYDNLRKWGIEGLVAIGGDGTFTGANIFSQEYDIPIIGIPATIDNDLVGTDYTIGYDTATNTAVDAIDKIRDTAFSHNRLFFVEVMGRHAGFIAIRSGLAAGAETILIPEIDVTTDEIIEKLTNSNKNFSLIIVAEGNQNGGAVKIAREVTEKLALTSKKVDAKVTVLGHIQRGGTPTVHDRVVASRMGIAAVEALRNGEARKMAGIFNNEIVLVPLEKAISGKRIINDEIWRISKILAT